MGKQIEVEGGEIAIKNSHGDIAIIPKKYRLEVEGMLKDGCHGCIDKLVSSLPKIHDYAKDGTVIPDDSKTNDNNQTYKEYRESLEALQPGLGTETSDYNLRGAWKGGLEPQKVEDGTYHLGSRNPKTGLLLKSVDHPTFYKMIEGEKEAGYEVYQDDNGSYYSYKSPALMINDEFKAVDYPPELLNNYNIKQSEIKESRSTQEDIGDNLKILSKRLLNGAKTFGASIIGDALYGIDSDLADYVSESTFGMVAPTEITEKTADETYSDFTQDAIDANLMFFAGEGASMAVSKLATRYGGKFLNLFKNKSVEEIKSITKVVDDIVPEPNTPMKVFDNLKNEVQQGDIMNSLLKKEGLSFDLNIAQKKLLDLKKLNLDPNDVNFSSNVLDAERQFNNLDKILNSELSSLNEFKPIIEKLNKNLNEDFSISSIRDIIDKVPNSKDFSNRVGQLEKYMSKLSPETKESFKASLDKHLKNWSGLKSPFEVIDRVGKSTETAKYVIDSYFQPKFKIAGWKYDRFEAKALNAMGKEIINNPSPSNLRKIVEKVGEEPEFKKAYDIINKLGTNVDMSVISKHLSDVNSPTDVVLKNLDDSFSKLLNTYERFNKVLKNPEAVKHLNLNNPKSEIFLNDVVDLSNHSLDEILPLFSKDVEYKMYFESEKSFAKSRIIQNQAKKELGIVYDPKEVYDKGYRFYHEVGKYHELKVDDPFSYLDNYAKDGGMDLSTMTLPDGSVDKEKLFLEIYPRSKDIITAANVDSYTGSTLKEVFPSKSHTVHTKSPADAETMSASLSHSMESGTSYNEIVINVKEGSYRYVYKGDNPEIIAKTTAHNKQLDKIYGKPYFPKKAISNKKTISQSELSDKLNILDSQFNEKIPELSKNTKKNISLMLGKKVFTVAGLGGMTLSQKDMLMEITKNKKK